MTLTPRLLSIARDLAAGTTWDTPEEAFYALGLTPAEQDAVCAAVARGLPRPGDGTDQPALPVDADGWGFPLKPGTQQPTLW